VFKMNTSKKILTLVIVAALIISAIYYMNYVYAAPEDNVLDNQNKLGMQMHKYEHSLNYRFHKGFKFLGFKATVKSEGEEKVKVIRVSGILRLNKSDSGIVVTGGLITIIGNYHRGNGFESYTVYKAVVSNGTVEFKVDKGFITANLSLTLKNGEEITIKVNGAIINAKMGVIVKGFAAAGEFIIVYKGTTFHGYGVFNTGILHKPVPPKRH